MSGEATPFGRTPRPVAGLPTPAGGELAKAWLLEVLSQRELAEIAEVPVARLVQDGPELCDAVVAAVVDDRALERLSPGGDLSALAARAGELTGAQGPVEVVAGVEALRAVVHRALRTDSDAAAAADTGDRLARVCAHVLAAALGSVASEGSAARPEPRPAPVAPPEPASGIVAAHGVPGDPPHLDAVTSLLAGRGAAPLALLAVELDDRDRLIVIEGEAALAADLAGAEAALAAEAGKDGILVREATGRWWLIAPDTDTDAARRLAQRAATTVTAHAPVRHGVPLKASVGVAVCPDDGTVAQMLADHADQGIFTARALGVSVA